MPTLRTAKISAGGGRSASQCAGKKDGYGRRGRNRADFGDHDAGPRFGDRQRRESALRHEAADDAIVVARRAAFMIAAFARFARMVGVFVMIAVIRARESGRALGGAELLAGMAMPQPAERAGQHVANRYEAGNSTMVRWRDHDARWLQMQLNCMIIKPARPEGQY